MSAEQDWAHRRRTGGPVIYTKWEKVRYDRWRLVSNEGLVLGAVRSLIHGDYEAYCKEESLGTYDSVDNAQRAVEKRTKAGIP